MVALFEKNTLVPCFVLLDDCLFDKVNLLGNNSFYTFIFLTLMNHDNYEIKKLDFIEYCIRINLIFVYCFSIKINLFFVYWFSLVCFGYSDELLV